MTIHRVIDVDNHFPVWAYILIRSKLVFSIRQLTELHPKMNRVIKNTLYTFIRALGILLYPMTLKMRIFRLVVRQTTIKYMFVVIIRCFRERLTCTL